MDAIQTQLPSRNQLSLALDGCTSTTKLAITSVIAYYMHHNWALREVQLGSDEVNHLGISGFKSELRMIDHRPTHWRDASRAFEGRA